MIGDERNDAALKADIEDNLWRVLYFLPVIFNFLMLFNMCCIIKEDSIMFNLSQNKEAAAMRLIDIVMIMIKHTFDIIS